MRERLEPVLSKVSRKRAVGLVVEDDRVTACRAVITPLGAVERGQYSEAVVAGEPPEKAVRRVLEAALDDPKWRHAPLSLGLPARGFLFTTRPSTTLNQESSGETLLYESMQAANVLVEELEIDVLRGKTSRGVDEALIVAARRKELAPLTEAVAAMGANLYGVEPWAFGLLRTAAARHPAPRKDRAVYRVFLDGSSGLVIRAAGARPEGWRLFAMAPGEEAVGLASAVGVLRVLARRRGETDGGPSRVIVHGRPELAEAIRSLPAWEALGVETAHHAGPSLDDVGAAALGLAAGCYLDDDVAHNLARGRRPRRSLASLFPWGQAAALALVLGGATALMMGQLLEVQTRANVTTARAQRYPWIKGKDVISLEKERADLTTRTELIRAYLTTRYQWARYTREVAQRMPDSMGITAFEGKNTLAVPGAKGAAVRSLELQVEAPLPPGTSIPADINVLMENMRSAPLLKESLPLITMSEMKFATVQGKPGTVASFNLRCSPVVKAEPKGKKGQG
jgi:hypothetical protein